MLQEDFFSFLSMGVVGSIFPPMGAIGMKRGSLGFPSISLPLKG